MAKKKVSGLASNELAREVRRRTRTLQRKRDRLRSQLEEVDRQIAELRGIEEGADGARGRGRRRRAPRNQQPLAEMLAKTLNKKRPMSVSEVTDAVQRAGYQTSASNFRAIVNNTLAKDERFKQTSRGKYVLA